MYLLQEATGVHWVASFVAFFVDGGFPSDFQPTRIKSILLSMATGRFSTGRNPQLRSSLEAYGGASRELAQQSHGLDCWLFELP